MAIRLNGLIRVGQSGDFAVSLLSFLRPEFLNAGFFDNDSLGFHLQKSVMGRVIAFETTNIQILNHDTRS